MQITIKVGSAITIPWLDSAEVESNNSAIAISASPDGGTTFTATQPGEAEISVGAWLFHAVILKVKVV